MITTGRLSLFILGTALLITAGCSQTPDASRPEGVAIVHGVRTAPVRNMSESGTQELVGTVTARNRAEIATKVQARIEAIPVKLGSHVAAGDPLAELDMRDIRARVAQTEAVHDQSARDLTRYEELFGRKLVSQQEYDRVKSQADISRATLQEAQAMLSYGRVVAPFAGVVTKKMVDLGDLVIPGLPLFTIEESANLRLIVAIPESHQDRVRLGDSLPVIIPSLDTVITGVLSEYSNSADPASRSFEAKVALPSLPGLRAGQYGRLRISSEASPAFFIPTSAVIHRGQLELVFVATDSGSASLRLIRTGRQLRDRTEVLSGLESNERVIVSGQETLIDSDRIRELP